MHRVGQVVASLMVVQTETIVVAPISFSIAVRLSQQEWNMIALAQIEPHCISRAIGSEKEKVW